MKTFSLYKYLTFSFLLLLLAGCVDRNRVIDTNEEVPNQNWTYLNKFKFDFTIDNEKATYNLYMNLRVTGNYKYSNLFVLITQTGADKKETTKRYELTLANREGEWLGKGSGNLYNYQLRFLTNYQFSKKGAYHIYIEQNMRDNPLTEVSDVGLRVEKVIH